MEPNCDGWTTPPVFSGNQFIGNVFRSPVGLIIPRMTVEINGTVSNNLLENNDFGSSDGPFLMPLSGFADGGGNICGPLSPALSNFVCTGGSRVVSGARPALWAPPSANRHGGSDDFGLIRRTTA